MRRKPQGGGRALVVHPDTPARAVASVAATYLWRNPGEWSIDFRVSASTAALRLPRPVAPERSDGLWHHTCFELFLRDPVKGDYLEFNFSPSGQWAAYQFDGYRSGMRELAVTAPRISSTDPAQYTLHVAFEHAGLWRGIDCVAGLSAVIEEADGTKSYWALAHPAGKPDFHHVDTFVLDLDGNAAE